MSDLIRLEPEEFEQLKESIKTLKIVCEERLSILQENITVDILEKFENDELQDLKCNIAHFQAIQRNTEKTLSLICKIEGE